MRKPLKANSLLMMTEGKARGKSTGVVNVDVTARQKFLKFNVISFN
jgi:hypothetical protein